jgi:hypothetical protein
MTDQPKRCPKCGTRYKWYEDDCPSCHVALIEERPADDRALSLVTVFRTADPGAIPLAELALEGEGIEYQVRNQPRDSLLQALGSQPSSVGPIEIVVYADVADVARELLSDLEHPTDGAPLDASGTPAITTPAAGPDAAPRDVRLEDEATGLEVGRITEAQLHFLASHLELESSDDRDFYIDAETVAMLREAGADAALVDVLRASLGSADGVDIRWSIDG